MTTDATIDVRDGRRPELTTDVICCYSCTTLVHLYQVFDGWESGVPRDHCPNCLGSLLPPVSVPA